MFEKLSPFIQDYIYAQKWDELRDIQVKACEVIFDSDDNLLLATGTASGKTEAAFLPCLTVVSETISNSVDILYISPLKALINDQFERLDELLLESNMQVFKWHGDVNQSKKKKFVRSPSGILQITPESLQSMLMNSPENILKLFKSLKFVVIDEVHYFMSIDRGIQLLAVLEQIQRMIDYIPRRVGLSATLGDYCAAERWLNIGTNRICKTPLAKEQPRKFKLIVRHFKAFEKDLDETLKGFYEMLYMDTLNKKTIIYSSSRDGVEASISKLKKLASENEHENDYLVHHGSISGELREYAERLMKSADTPLTIGATLTLELGIDIGALDKVICNGSPISVSSFVQRLGRTGRRNISGMMIFNHIHMLKEKDYSYNDFDWGLLKTIASIELYARKKWVETPKVNQKNFSLLYHQTMCYIKRRCSVSPQRLAQEMLTLEVFKSISKDDYRVLLKHLLEINHLELMDDNKLIIGKNAERIINHYSFLAVFKANEEYKVYCKKQLIGSIDSLLPEDTTFNLAGSMWVVTSVNEKAKNMIVLPVDDKFKTFWNKPTIIPVDKNYIRIG